MRFRALIFLMAAIACAIPVHAQKEEGRIRPADARQRELRMRRARIDLERAEREMNFEQEMREIELEKQRRDLDREQHRGARHCGHRKWGGCHRHCGFMAICALVHLLLAVWVFQDIRARGAGSGLWIVITLLAGFFGALIYAVVRIGDRPKEA